MDQPDFPAFAELATDPEIAPLLNFDPVPVKPKVNGWDPEAQRAFIAFLAVTGSKLRAARAIGRKSAGLDRIFAREDAAGFLAAHDAALRLFRKRESAGFAEGFTAAARRSLRSKPGAGLPLPGQVMNERGEWEDEESLRKRGLDAADRVGMKLIRCRRAFLAEISSCPGKRAAFEVLTELPVDWEIAERYEPQPFEPWTRVNMRQADMVLTAESGWAFGELGYGPDRKKQAREALDAYLIENGQQPVDWEAE